MKSLLLFLALMVVYPLSWAANVRMGVINDWDQGFAAIIKIDNTNGSAPVSNRALNFAFQGIIDNIWDAKSTKNGQAYRFDKPDWKENVAVGWVVEYGFQGSPGNISILPALSLIGVGPNPTSTVTVPSTPTSSQTTSSIPSVTPRPTFMPSSTSIPKSDSSRPSFEGVVACGVNPVNLPNDDDWLTTQGNQIVDSTGNSVWLTGANWFGYNTRERVFHGLWGVNLENFVEQVAARGINVIRVPIGTEIMKEWKNNIYGRVNVNYYVNPKLKEKTSLEIFDQFLNVSKACGIKVLVDVHHPDQNNEGHHYWGWKKDEISLDDFYDTWEWFAKRYKNDDTIIGFDLQNEPHGGPKGSIGNSLRREPDESWEAFCQRKPETEDSEFAKWDNSSDVNNWRHVAETVASRILNVHPNGLILVEGIEAYPRYGKWINNNVSPVLGEGDECYDFNWWGGNLRGVADLEVNVLGHQNQIMYSTHDYGPLVFLQTWFQGDFNRDSLREEVWEPNWLFIHSSGISPLLIGEWGGFMDGGINQKWMEALRDEIVELKLHHTVWGLNPNSGDTGGLVEQDWTTWDEEKYQLLKPALWQTQTGKFIGLDHKAKLGGKKNTGVALEYVY